MEVPPKLIKGKVIPVVGISPVTTATFKNALKIILNDIAKANN